MRHTNAMCPNCGFRHHSDDYAKELMGIKMPGLGRRIVASLANGKGGVVPWARIVDDVYGHRIDGGPAAARENISTSIRRISARIAERGWAIENDLGHGYRLVRIAMRAAA